MFQSLLTVRRGGFINFSLSSVRSQIGQSFMDGSIGLTIIQSEDEECARHRSVASILLTTGENAGVDLMVPDINQMIKLSGLSISSV